MNKIFLVGQAEVTSKVGGGITVFVNMCNLFAKNGYDIYGLCYSEINNTPYGLDPGIRFVNLYKQGNNTGRFADAFQEFVRNEKPDLIIFSFHHLYIDAKLGHEFDHIPRILMFQSRPTSILNLSTIQTNILDVCTAIPYHMFYWTVSSLCYPSTLQKAGL